MGCPSPKYVQIMLILLKRDHVIYKPEVLSFDQSGSAVIRQIISSHIYIYHNKGFDLRTDGQVLLLQSP